MCYRSAGSETYGYGPTRNGRVCCDRASEALLARVAFCGHGVSPNIDETWAISLIAILQPTRLRDCDVATSVNKLGERWLSTRHATGRLNGWSRVLENHQKFGIVATANAIEAMIALELPIRDPDLLVESLRTERLDDHSWPFKATVTRVGVVDSTATVLVSLSRLARTFDLHSAAQTAASLIDDGAAWLMKAQLDDGSWGLVSREQISAGRPYSTALAIQALSAWENQAARTSIDAAVSYLLASQTPGGAWIDATRQESVPSTAEVLRALTVARDPHRPLASSMERAQAWLRDVGNATDGWVMHVPGELEEVAANIGGSSVRIDYNFCSRPMAIRALLESGSPVSVGLLRAATETVKSARISEWTQYAGGRFKSNPPSWMLYDVSMAISHIRTYMLSHCCEIWVGAVRHVRHPPARSWLSRRVREYYPAMLFVLVVTVLTAIGSAAYGALWPLVASFLGTVLLTFIVDVTVELLKRPMARLRLSTRVERK